MDVPLQIAFKDMQSSEFLEALIRDRADRLETFHSHVVACRVVVDFPHKSSASAKQPVGISVEVSVPGSKTLVAKESQERRDLKNDLSGVVNRAFDRIERQLEDHSAVRGGEVKAHASDGQTGRVVRLFPEQDYGFVEVAGAPDLHFTRNAVQGGGYDDLQVGSMVAVTIAGSEGPMGPQASSVRPLGTFSALK